MNGLDVKAGSRSAVTLGALAVVFVASAAWGWAKVTQPFPEKVEAAPCTSTLIPKGDDLAPPQVMVTVLNGGGPNGLAGTTMDKLVGFGFAKGDTGNAPKGTDVPYAQIWTETPRSPDVLLVAAHLGPDTQVVRRNGRGVGVTVMVGDAFEELVKKAPRRVVADEAATICSPPVS